MVTQTFSQYLSPSWQLTIHSNPSPLSQWLGEPVVRQLQFEMVRLWSPVSTPEPDFAPEAAAPSLVSESALQGDEQLLQDLYEVLQGYIEQHLGRGFGALVGDPQGDRNGELNRDPNGSPIGAGMAASGISPMLGFGGGRSIATAPPESAWEETADPATDPATDPGTDPGTDPALEPALTQTVGQAVEMPPPTASNLAVLPIEAALDSDLAQDLTLDLDPETLASLETTNGFDDFLEDRSPDRPSIFQLEPVSALRHRLQYRLAPVGPPTPHWTSLEITTLELFDLVDVLDQWHSSMVFLPGLAATGRTETRPWLKSAALVLVTVGVTVGGMQILQSWNRDQVALSPSAETAAPLDGSNPGLGNLGSGPLGADLEARLELGQGPPSPDSLSPNGLGLPAIPGATSADGLSASPIPLGASQPLPQSSAATLPPPPPPGWLTLPPPPPISAPGALVPLPSSPQQLPLPQTGTASAGSSRSSAPSAPRQTSPNPSPSLADGEELAALARGAVPAEETARAEADAASSAAKAAIDAETTNLQVAAVRSYFQSVWQAPESLTQPIQYGLVIGPGGDLRAIDPQDTTAGNFLDRTGMPLLGTAFVPSASDGYSRSMRLTLHPNGSVEVYSLGAW